MCPDKQMLSLFFDNELPSPWKEKLEAHVEKCPRCKEILNVYKGVSTGLQNSGKLDSASVAAAQDRLWNKIRNTIDIDIDIGIDDFDAGKKSKTVFQKRMWSRSIEVPVPFAAAAAALAVLFFAFLLTRTTPVDEKYAATPIIAESEVDGAVFPAGFDAASSTLPANMADILRYLETDESNDIVIVKLPEKKKFIRYGEPTMLKASDYPGSVKH